MKKQSLPKPQAAEGRSLIVQEFKYRQIYLYISNVSGSGSVLGLIGGN